MKQRFATLLVLSLIAAACGGSDFGGPSGVDRGPTTTRSPASATDSRNPDVHLPAIVEPCEPPEELEAFCGPFSYEQGTLLIVWDRWFWGQGMFSRGTVEVFEGEDLLVSGPFSDESVMKQETNGDLIFLDADGGVVTLVTQSELSPAIQAALEQAGIG